MSTRRNQLTHVAVVLFCLCLLGSATVYTQNQRSETRSQKLYRIEVEDADEAALIEQELKVKPELVRGRSFYYYGNENINRRLQEFGYHPSVEDADSVLTRVVRVVGKGTEAPLREIGLTIVLRERGYWIARGTLKQLRALSRAEYAIQDLRKGEPYPRQVRLTVTKLSDVSDVVAPRIDIHTVQKSKEGFVVFGGAFDESLDELRAMGFKVEILPDPPGVTR